MSDLKPCPFCGSTAQTWADRAAFYVACYECGIDMSSGKPEEAIEAWNRRAQPAQAGLVLTDEEIDAAWNECDWYETKRAYFDAGVHWAQKAVLAKRVPMTDAQIAEYQEDGVFWQSCKHIVRDIEKFHGIVGEKGVAT